MKNYLNFRTNLYCFAQICTFCFSISLSATKVELDLPLCEKFHYEVKFGEARKEKLLTPQCCSLFTCTCHWKKGYVIQHFIKRSCHFKINFLTTAIKYFKAEKRKIIISEFVSYSIGNDWNIYLMWRPYPTLCWTLKMLLKLTSRGIQKYLLP